MRGKTTDTMSAYTTNTSPTPDRWAVLERCRQRLHWIACRITGCWEDAEDVVQEASLRWLEVDPATVRTPEGWLVAVTTRLSIDRARRASTERQAYRTMRELARDTPSAWDSADVLTELAAQVSEAFRILRARLEPAERTAFVLREAFACEYEEIARRLGKTQAACRQIVHRARERLHRAPPELALCVDEPPDLVERFLSALAADDCQGVLAALNGPATGTRRRALVRRRRVWEEEAAATASPAA